MEPTTVVTLSQLLHNISKPAIVIGGIIFVIYLVKSIYDYTASKAGVNGRGGRGKSSPTSIAIGAILILICIGLIYYVTNDFDSVVQMASQIAGSGMDTLTDVATDTVTPEQVTTE